MSGIYLHIPFCKQACHYCNFHFSTSLKYKDDFVAALLQEIEMQKSYLNAAPLNSVYFGGGTPSLLNNDDLEKIFSKIKEVHSILPDAEITLEANPDDLTNEKLKFLADSPVNRLSIGIQSFFDADLQYMNRAHNATEAVRCISQAKKYGFDNITVDLIYGTPTMNNQEWQQNIAQVLDLDIPHISCYALTVEPNTALAHFIKKGKSAPVNEEQTAEQFEYLCKVLQKAGYDHYEISNFAKPKHYAVHNANYWKGEHYLGIGPSAHSFNGISRQWNIANNALYLKSIQAGKVPYEKEILSAENRYNEYILTALRTIWGVNFDRLAKEFQAHFLERIQPYIDNQTIQKSNNNYRLTEKGKLLADNISMQLFVDEE